MAVQAVQACTLSCKGGIVDCDQGLLLHYAPHLRDLLSTDACLCTNPVLILPDFMVKVVRLAVNLMVKAAGKEVMLEYQSLQPAGPVFLVLGINFTCGYEVQSSAPAQVANVTYVDPPIPTADENLALWTVWHGVHLQESKAAPYEETPQCIQFQIIFLRQASSRL